MGICLYKSRHSNNKFTENEIEMILKIMTHNKNTNIIESKKNVFNELVTNVMKSKKKKISLSNNDKDLYTYVSNKLNETNVILNTKEREVFRKNLYKTLSKN